MKKTTKNLISLGVVVLVIAVLYTVITVFGLTPRLGLDLQGGISIVYEAVGPEVDAGVMDLTIEKMRERIDRLGVAEPEISRQGDRNVVVQLPGIDDAQRAKDIVGQTAQLQFRIVEDTRSASEAEGDPEWEITTGEEELQPDREIVLPYDTATPDDENGETEETLLRLGPTLMLGDEIEKAMFGIDQQGFPKVDFELKPSGKDMFAGITTENTDKQLAIVLDYRVESAPVIRDPITGGKGEITGNFTDREARDLVIVLNTGALPVELKPINEQDVTATLGRDSLRQGLIAGLAGLLVVAVYMLVFYRMMGLVTCLSLVVFGALTYGLVTVLGEFWSLTLAGIAGVIVAIGMAADSSIVYFERLKEDVREGRSLRSSVESSFKSAFRTILSAGVVSFTAAAILYIFAVGGVKGFAFTLGMATVLILFICYFFTRPLTSLLAQWKTFGTPAAMGIRMRRSQNGGDAG